MPRGVVESSVRESLLELKSGGLNLKFDQPSEVTFKDVSGKLPST